MFGLGGKTKDLQKKVDNLDSMLKAIRTTTQGRFEALETIAGEHNHMIKEGKEDRGSLFEKIRDWARNINRDMDHRSKHVEELFNTVNGELNGIKKQMLAFEDQIAKIVAAMEPRKAKPAPQEDDGNLFQKKRVVKVRKKRPEPWARKSIAANLRWQERAEALGHPDEKSMWLERFGAHNGGGVRLYNAVFMGVSKNILPHRWAKCGLGWKQGDKHGKTIVYELKD